MGRRKYTEEFKREAVELSFNSDKSCKVIAEELGINYNLLIRWRKEYKEKAAAFFSILRRLSSLHYKGPEEYENERNIFKLCV